MKLRPKKFASGKEGWEVDLGKVEGKRVQRYFQTKGAAEKFMERTGQEKKESGELGLTLSPADKALFLEVKGRLAAAGVTIVQVADYWFEHHRPVKERLRLGDLLDRCVLDMELRKVAPNTIATFACACRSFVEPRRAREVGMIKREEIRSWIFGNGWEPKTQRGYLGALVELFNYAVRDAQCLAESPLAKVDGKLPIKLPKLKKKEPAIFTVDQLERLFTTAQTKHELGVDPRDDQRKPMPIYRRLLGFLALATFAGIRPFELVRLEVTTLDLAGRVVPLDAGVTKTNDRRVVELSENCVKWLKLWRKEFPQYDRIAPPSWDRLMKGLRKAAGLQPWPHDVLRHCFASYFHATYGDKTKLQNQMGHSESEDTLDKHYRAVRLPNGRPLTQPEALKFWKIAPQ
ncbi:MAG TPA: site-specific integrase [Chthoniobacter sp.]|jgi:integrase